MNPKIESLEPETTTIHPFISDQQEEHQQLFAKADSYSQDDWEDEDQSTNVSSEYFDLKVRPSHTHQYQLKGSWRLCYSLLFAVIGFLSIYILNLVLDHDCLQQFQFLQCSITSATPKCQQLLQCIQSKSSYFFTTEENIVLAMMVVVTSIYLCNDQKTYPPKLIFRSLNQNKTGNKMERRKQF